MEEQTQQPQTVEQTGKKGGSKVILVIILLIIVLAGAYVAYAKIVKKASVGQIFSPSALKLDPNCRYNDPDLCKFMNNWKDVNNFTMTSESTEAGSQRTMVLKSEGDDKTQIIMTDGGKESYNAINIANTTYTKDYTDNKWFKFTTSADSDIARDAESEIDFDAKAEDSTDKTTYKKIGTEACGKLTCFKYQVEDPEITDPIQYIYFDNKEYKLRKLRMESKDGTIDESTFDYSKVSISEPSPVKEGSPVVPVSADEDGSALSSDWLEQIQSEAEANGIDLNSSETDESLY